MSYSFIKPKRKPRFDSESRMILIFLTVTLLLVFGFTAYILLKKRSMQSDIVSMRERTASFHLKSREFKEEISRIERLVRKYDTISTNNTLMKESIQNLFDLVPDQITLTKAILDRNGLVLYGVTPSKDVYNYLLLAPLKSVFQRNVTTFYPLENGWWRFVSVNEGSIEAGSEVEE
ncbi:putative membrane protein [Hydrogenimonas sp.]|nr:putative membrane protein [Hydrogenimonas sp.]